MFISNYNVEVTMMYQLAKKYHYTYFFVLQYYVLNFQLAHPGLTIKKIRVTKDTICQLFDFCIRDEASRVVEDMKKKVCKTSNVNVQ